MKQILLAFLLFICTPLSFSQFKGTDKLIEELSNKDLYLDHQGSKTNFRFESKAAIKLERKGRKATKALLKALEDDSRNIAAHIVLCKIYFGKVTFAGPKIESENEHYIYKYFIGEERGKGLVICEKREASGPRIYIEESELNSIKTYWKSKIETGN